MEFEQMIADDEPATEGSTKGAEEASVEPPADPPVRRKAKTKIGNKSKKKKKTKTTSKFPDGEEGLQVELSCLWLVRSLLFQILLFQNITKQKTKMNTIFIVQFSNENKKLLCFTNHLTINFSNGTFEDFLVSYKRKLAFPMEIKVPKF